MERGNDELARWAKDKFSHAFASTNDPDVLQSYASIITWAQASTQFSLAAKTEFAGVADGWLVAYAKAKAGIIVTLEVLQPSSKSRIPIPNVCHEFGVTYVDSFEMLRRLGVQFS